MKNFDDLLQELNDELTKKSDRIKELEKRNQMKDKELEEMNCKFVKVTELNEQNKIIIEELRNKIEFCNGQIEAYKYCIKCKR